MTEHTKFARFITRQKEGMRAAREKKETRVTERFEQQKTRLEREGEIEERRARIRKQQAVARPKGAPVGEGWGQRFVRTQQSFFPAPARQAPTQRRPVRRRVRRTTAPMYYDRQGRPIQVARRVAKRKARRQPQRQQRYDPFAPTFRL